MSRAVRRQLLENLATLKEANGMLVSLLKSGEKEAFFSLLENCQECAIAIGTHIDAVYGEETKSVQELEVFCEMVYYISQMQESEDCAKKIGKLEAQLKSIEACMKEELSNQLEVVFLPYNATMWDSLESIWLAAKECNEYDTYVIPIPYYEKDKNGCLTEEHYEGEEYPEYVPIVHYSTYDFEQRQPDIIFIHNPYDGGNNVTSVHPFFYSENLKKFTSTLVYVPYFVLDGKGISENLVLNTGVLNSDYVIVQNEKEKEDYIRHFQKKYPQLQIEKKLLPLGSPKLDKVRRISKENVVLPQEWEKRCKGKKVILYNTNIVGILHGNEQYLKKMKSVFDFFKGREDLVVIWRPHPLMEQTVSAMRSKLHEEYVELKERFLQEDIGIYDDGKDMYPAILLSDVYYGDWSSLIWLYRETGKSIRVQCVDDLTGERDWEEAYVVQKEFLLKNYGKDIILFFAKMNRLVR